MNNTLEGPNISRPHYPEIFDAHTHIYPEKIAAKAVTTIGDFYDLPMTGKGTAEDLIQAGARAGIRRFLVSSAATGADQVASINNFIASQCHAHPELIGFGTFFPGLADPDGEIERMLALGLKGVKLHSDFQRIPIDMPELMPVYERLEGVLPVLFHVGDRRMDFSSPYRLIRVLDRFPKLTVIAAHLGGYSVWDDARVLLGRDIYLDTSSSLKFLRKEEVVGLIREHGAHKVLFGTDYPMWSHQEELSRFLDLGLSEEENQKILFGNAAALFQLI